jgi:hypothetical protein
MTPEHRHPASRPQPGSGAHSKKRPVNALLKVTDRAPERRGQKTERPEFLFSEQLCAHFDANTRAVWSRWTPSPRPNFNYHLLSDLARYCSFVARTDGRIECLGEAMPMEFTVLASGATGVFNLGGDLDLFTSLIHSRDRGSLLTYGKACIDVLYRNYIGHGLPMTTISLVQGECLGGGFEAALSSDIVVAERHAHFGFPEISFNLFPGMGPILSSIAGWAASSPRSCCLADGSTRPMTC